MPKTSTSFKKGPRKVGRAKGTRNKRTLLKESLGLKNWDQLTSYIEKEGAQKMVKELLKMKGKDFSTTYTALMEFVKPKLSRADYNVSQVITQQSVKIGGKKLDAE
jgi:hypothetical protein